MFEKSVYVERRAGLRSLMGSGVVVIVGNELSPMNYPDNTFPFRQDSSFLYYFGLDDPGLTGVVDVDAGAACVFGDDLTEDDIIWTGRQPSVAERCELIGVDVSGAREGLRDVLDEARRKGRAVHWLPQYRAENVLWLAEMMRVSPAEVTGGASAALVRAVVAQRSIKSDAEVAQIEIALDTCHKMQVGAMQYARPGMYEREVAGLMEGVAVSSGVALSFPTIFSVHGETLHNHYHGNRMEAGDIVVNDSGAESPLHYAGDITRTIPIGGKFDSRQRDIYRIVFDAQQQAIEAVRPGVEFRDVHVLAGRVLLEGLKGLGLVKGDPEEGARAGAHTLFFQCGLGHMMGLDVHDMEGLGEDYVGYTDAIKRDPAFGFRSLRLGKALEAGYVITVEPGLYFIGELIDRFRAEGKFAEFINYDKVELYREFGGVRLEDDVLVTEDGYRALGKPIPKEIDEVEGLCAG